MKQPKEINGKLYSRKPFDGYTHCVTVKCEETMFLEHILHVYTDDYDKYRVMDVLLDLSTADTTKIKIINFETKEHVGIQEEMIDSRVRTH